jgi:mannose-6-phosphate isomerase-like protein (cupin superfamily)
MSIEGKIWGSTEDLIKTPLFEIHRLVIKPKARCSEHYHRYKHNAFLVVEGELLIHVEQADYQLTDVTTLKAGDVTTVKPGLMHWFATEDSPCLAYELYYCEPLSKDIIRRNVGSASGRTPPKRVT